MGMSLPLLEIILHEHRHRKLEGDALFLGRQTVFASPAALSQLIVRHGITPPPGFHMELDTETRAGKAHDGRLVTDRCFMKLLGIDSFHAIDYSPYEGADIVHDMGRPVDPSLDERFDFIFNGSCLDNMFNPAQALINTSRMLRPHGRIVHFEHGSSFNCPYLMYSPGYFFDYYVTNGFADVQVYVGVYTSAQELYVGPWQLFYYSWLHDKGGATPTFNVPAAHSMIIVIAEKQPGASVDRHPVQWQYRGDADHAWFDEKVQPVLASPRAVFGQDGPVPNPEQHGYVNLGMITQGIHL